MLASYNKVGKMTFTYMKLKKEGQVFKITLLGMCLALFIVLNYASFVLVPPSIKFSLKGLPIIFVSVCFGPWYGALLGGVGEFICQLVSEYGLTPTTPLWILPWIVEGIIVGLFFKHKDIRQHPYLWVITVLVSCLAVTILNTIALWLDSLIFGYNPRLTAVTIPLRFVNSVVTSIVTGALMPVFFIPLIKQGKFEIEE